jgi:hypothetical protein
MKLLKCKLCNGEVDIIGNHRAICKKIKCRKCHYTNAHEKEKIITEVVILKKK